NSVAGEPRFELGRVERLGPRLDQSFELHAGFVGTGPDRAAFLGRQLGDAAQNRGQLRLAAEVADPQLLQLGAAGRGLDRRRGLAPDLLDPIKHLARPPAWRAKISARRKLRLRRRRSRTPRPRP